MYNLKRPVHFPFRSFFMQKNGVDYMFKDNSAQCKQALLDAELKWLKACGEMSKDAIKSLVKTRTGALKESIRYQIDETKKECIVGTDKKYAPYLEFGTGIHAENGDGRKIPWVYKDEETGEEIFTRGSKPYPYMRPGFRQVKPKAQALLRQYVADIGGFTRVTFNRSQYTQGREK